MRRRSIGCSMDAARLLSLFFLLILQSVYLVQPACCISPSLRSPRTSPLLNADQTIDPSTPNAPLPLSLQPASPQAALLPSLSSNTSSDWSFWDALFGNTTKDDFLETECLEIVDDLNQQNLTAFKAAEAAAGKACNESFTEEPRCLFFARAYAAARGRAGRLGVGVDGGKFCSNVGEALFCSNTMDRLLRSEPVADLAYGACMRVHHTRGEHYCSRFMRFLNYSIAHDDIDTLHSCYLLEMFEHHHNRKPWGVHPHASLKDLLKDFYDALASTYREPAKAFDDSDKNNDGYLDQAEFDVLVSHLGVAYSQEEINALFKAFDEDKSGKISKAEWDAHFAPPTTVPPTTTTSPPPTTTSPNPIITHPHTDTNTHPPKETPPESSTNSNSNSNSNSTAADDMAGRLKVHEEAAKGQQVSKAQEEEMSPEERAKRELDEQKAKEEEQRRKAVEAEQAAAKAQEELNNAAGPIVTKPTLDKDKLPTDEELKALKASTTAPPKEMVDRLTNEMEGAFNQWSQSFKAADANSDGNLTHGEVDALAQQLRIAGSPEEVDTLFKSLDGDKDGQVSKAEWQAHFGGITVAPKEEPTTTTTTTTTTSSPSTTTTTTSTTTKAPLTQAEAKEIGASAGAEAGATAGRQSGHEAGGQAGEHLGRQAGREAGASAAADEATEAAAREAGRQAGRDAGQQQGKEVVNWNVTLPPATPKPPPTTAAPPGILTTATTPPPIELNATAPDAERLQTASSKGNETSEVSEEAPTPPAHRVEPVGHIVTRPQPVDQTQTNTTRTHMRAGKSLHEANLKTARGFLAKWVTNKT
ncbi:unnamed protein product [Vitrella brassicaformis CCMP3155]|uniref:EF-hand domain-containing protein n=1 Tax=Vitrella brassicaformis (strain CCMP3155) TaxID=1169540 RepID=A0A0G4GAS1_VITBC|nr:unnamed protein product [Vitrella brassicaformis CCMP3155]|eukprot:CEM26143.1 unnamed protein product [Vitrella brassicaformis CCMP3155]